MLQEVAGWTALLYERKIRSQNVISSRRFVYGQGNRSWSSLIERQKRNSPCLPSRRQRRRRASRGVIYRALAAEDGIREFLLPSFEALNTESIDRIADEVILWLRSRNTSLTRKI